MDYFPGMIKDLLQLRRHWKENPQGECGSCRKLVCGEREMYSRKVFIGGLPPDIDEGEILESFNRFGELTVDWPKKDSNPVYMFPPQGFAFLLFKTEASVHNLVDACFKTSDGRILAIVSSLSMSNKVIEVKPWSLRGTIVVINDFQFTTVHQQYKIFVGGIPRYLTAEALARIFWHEFGNVIYVEILLEKNVKYPRGSAIVCFSDHYSYLAAVQMGILWIQSGTRFKYMDLKPFDASKTKCSNYFDSVTPSSPSSSERDDNESLTNVTNTE